MANINMMFKFNGIYYLVIFMLLSSGDLKHVQVIAQTRRKSIAQVHAHYKKVAGK